MIKRKTKEVWIWSIVIILIVASIIGIVFFGSQEQVMITGDSEKLDFCSTTEECISYLKLQGMPDNFLEQNNINIVCEGGICYAKK